MYTCWLYQITVLSSEALIYNGARLQLFKHFVRRGSSCSKTRAAFVANSLSNKNKSSCTFCGVPVLVSDSGLVPATLVCGQDLQQIPLKFKLNTVYYCCAEISEYQICMNIFKSHCILNPLILKSLCGIPWFCVEVS